MTRTKSVDGLVPLTDESRLRKNDALRERNIGQHLPLPQLVVVGDQSSGKSSLLENLTGIPFPRGQERCTRYATQITSRRDDSFRIDITIIPSPSASDADKERLEGFHKELSSTEELRDQFASIMDEVNVCMNIRTSFEKTSNKDAPSKVNGLAKKVFSEDVLKIEICGPEEDYLTVIDVPGIFRSADEFTTNEDKDLVLDMIRRYIKDDRTIILAVLPANVDVQTQEILDLAAQYDKEGERTLGILTKVDLCKEQSSKIPVCRLIQGTKKPLRLGYYLVRNLGGDEDETVDVAQKEAELFRQAPWDKLPRDRLGIGPLRERLAELLNEITDKAFPKMRTQCRQMMQDAQLELDGLGESRQTETEQRLYLAGLAGQFQELVRAALAADYSRHAAFDDNFSLRLLTLLVNFSESFSTYFEKRAHTREFENSAKGSAKILDHLGDDIPAAEDGKTASLSNKLVANLHLPQLDSYPDLANILPPKWIWRHPGRGIMEWIQDLYHKHRGVELGSIGAGVLPSAFKEQSKHWSILAHQYVSKIVLCIHQFVFHALEIVCPDVRVRGHILASITKDLLSRYRKGLDHAKFLVSVERDQRPFTLNHYFNDNLQVRRGARVAEALRSEAHPRYPDSKLVVDFDEIAGAVTAQSNADHAQEDIYDILHAYYKVARKRFVDNLYLQAVDHFLVSGPSSPLTVFCERWVVNLDREKLEEIAGESRLTREKRVALNKKIEDLSEAIKIMR